MFLGFEQLQCGRFAEVVHVLLVGQAVESHAAVVGDAVLAHDLIDAVEDEGGLRVVGLHALVYHLRQLWIVAHEEPGVYGDAVAAHAGTGLQDVDAGMHVADAYNLIDIHVVVAADARQLVGKGDVHGTVGVLDDLGHLGSAYVGDDDVAPAERGVVALYLLAYLAVVGTDGAVVVQQLVDHVAGDDALGGMHEVEVFAQREACLTDDGTHELVDGARADGAFDDEGGSLGAYLHHVLDGCHDIAGIYLLGEFVVGGRDADDIGVGMPVFGGEADAGTDGSLEELVETFFLEGGPAGVQLCHEFLVIVGAYDLHTM